MALILTPIARLTATWSGFAGANGYTSFYWDHPTGYPAGVLAFFNQLKAWLPNDATVTVPGSGFIIDPVLGAATGTWSASGGGSVTGLDSGLWSAASGSVIRWTTGDLNPKGHRIFGRTFLVPLGGTAYGNDGQLTSTFTAEEYNATVNLRTAGAGNQVVWGRPVNKRPSPGAPIVHISDGYAAKVLDAFCPSKVAVMRSRRD